MIKKIISVLVTFQFGFLGSSMAQNLPTEPQGTAIVEPTSDSSSNMPSSSSSNPEPMKNVPTATASAATIVDDGSNDTASMIARAKRQIREGMERDVWLKNSIGKISMSADGESLTLSGYVSHSNERDAIDRIARESAGSLRLINSIRIR